MENDRFSLQANVALPAHAREQLEHLCRYLLRPGHGNLSTGQFQRRRRRAGR